MANNISINPFTNTPLTEADIIMLDTNNDGIITATELYSNAAFISMYANSQDNEGEVDIDEENDALKNFAEGGLDLLKASTEPVIGTVKGTAEFAGDAVSGIVSGGYSLCKGLYGQISNVVTGVVRTA